MPEFNNSEAIQLTTRIFRLMASMLGIVLLAGVLGTTLVRFAPGFMSDEENLDARLSAESQQALRAKRLSDTEITVFYARYLSNIIRGDLGVSHSLKRPVRELLKERFPTTLHTVCWGLLLGWIFGLSTGVAATSVRQMGLEVFLNFIVSALLCFPAAVIALFFLQLGDAGPFVLSLLIFPKVHRYCQDLLTESYRMPHVITARAKGLGWPRILCFHVFTSAAPELLALVGVTTSIALGSAIPVEVICDSPGIGQLAWQAALSRDLPLLVNLTLIVTAITVLVNSFSESCACAFRRKVV